MEKRKGVNEFSSGPVETAVRFHLNIKITFLTIQEFETRNMWLWGWWISCSGSVCAEAQDGWKMEVTDGTPALGGNWTGQWWSPLSNSKLSSSVTSPGIGGDPEDLVTQCTESTYYPQHWWAAVFNFHCWQTKRKWPLVASVEMSEERKHQRWESDATE